jgi:tetratricopeptide (TPR) repeat protein
MDSKEINKIKQDSRTLQKAHQLRTGGNTKKSIPLYKKLANSANWVEQLEGVNGLALAYKMEEDYQRAIDYYHKAIRISEENNYHNRIKDIWRDIAISQQYQKRYQKAEEAYRKAIELTKKHGYGSIDSNPSYGITLVKYGHLHYIQKEYGEAEQLINKGIDILKKAKHKFWLMTGKLHLAQVYKETGREDKALEILKEQAEICQEENWYYREIQALAMIDEINDNNNNRERIKELIEKMESPKVAKRLKKNFGF